jgi:hypothetical protein
MTTRFEYRVHQPDEPHRWDQILTHPDQELCWVCGRVESKDDRKVVRAGKVGGSGVGEEEAATLDPST